MRFLKFLACVGFLSVCSVLLPAGDTQSGSTTISTQANLVLVPVVVEEKSGQHATGLTVADFELFDSGKPKAITTFEEVKAPTEHLVRQGKVDVFTNMVKGGQFNQLTIIALDLVNTPFLDQTYARRELIKFLARKVTAQEPTALVAIQSNGVRVLHDFTSDPVVLVETLQKASSELPLSQVRSNISDFVTTSDTYGGYANSAQITLEAFKHIAEAFAGIPGRKTMIWATASFPFAIDPSNGQLGAPRLFSRGQNTWSGTGMDRSGNLPALPGSESFLAGDLHALEPLYQSAIQKLNDSNISVYPVDARGLVTFFPGADTAKITGLNSYNQAIFDASRDTMLNFAKMTGGKAYYNRNDLDTAFQKAAEDSRAYYMLGYYLDKDAKPGWHKLQVKVKRDGVRVLARNGYFASQAASPQQNSSARSDIALAVASPFDYTAMPLIVRWTSLEPSGDKRKIHFQLLMPPSAGVVDVADKNHVDLQVVAVARNTSGQQMDQFAEHINTNLTAVNLTAVQKDGLSYKNLMQLVPGQYSVRFVVRDNLSGRIGSVLAPVTVTQ